ncbi:MAG: GlsB/YeaQ/YmgE family stress response membrane protein [Candidatus Paceibacterota bacterium]
MGIITWIILGGLAGWVASEWIIVGGDDGIGIIGNIILGIVGAAVGGWIAEKLGAKQGGAVMSFIWAVVGAVVILALVNLIF